MIQLIFECGGCDARAEAGPIRHRFHGLDGKSYGFGRWIWDTPDELAPAGWIASDLIGASYCPKCALELYPEWDHLEPKP